MLSLFCMLTLSSETDELQVAVTGSILPPEDSQSGAEEILLTSQSKLAGEANVSAVQ